MRRVSLGRGHPDVLYGESPYGWRLSNDRSRLVLDENEQRVIAVVRHMYFVERIPLRAIRDQLRNMGVVNRRGRPFGLSRVFEIVQRPPRITPPEAKKR